MLVALRQHLAAIGVTERVIGLQRDRLVEIGERLVEIAELGIGAAAIIEEVVIVLIQLDRAVVIVERSCLAA